MYNSALVDTAKQFSKMILPVYNLPVAYENFLYSASLLTLSILCLSFILVILMNVVTLCCGFNLQYLETNEVKHLCICLLAILWSACSSLLSIFLLITPSLEDYVDQYIFLQSSMWTWLCITSVLSLWCLETIKLPENGIFLKIQSPQEW